MASSKAFEDLDLSQEEIKRIGEALKDEKFRKLFVEYAEELSNPENRKRYEEEISMLERERGMNVQFVNPQPGHVLKTTVDGNKKAFINICTSDKIGKPNAKKHTNTEGKRGLYWQIPHSFSPPREEIDKEGKKCMVYDVVFHPDTYRMADNSKFKKMVEDTALEGIEKQFDCKLDRHNIRRPKLKYKGSPVATVIRSRADDKAENIKQEEGADILKDMPYPYGDLTSEELANKKNEELKKKEAEKLTKANKTKSNIEKKEEIGYTTPKYTIIHRSDMDIQEFRNAPDSRPSTRPKELVVSIELPLCKSATGVALDIFEDKLSLKSETPAYKLDIKLPYQVDDELGSAKFDKTRKLLIITLPVVPGEDPKLPSFIDDKDTVTSENGLTDNPLIEELPPLEEIDSEQYSNDMNELPPLESIDSEPQASGSTESTSEVITGAKSTHMVAYALPEFDFNQDSETVTFLFHVRNVNEETVSKTFPEVGMCRIRFASLGSGGFPMHYSFFVRFEQDCELVPEYCTVDVSDKNMSVILLKTKEARFLWNKFMVGLDENTDLEEKLFLTETNLQAQLDQLEAESSTMGQTDEQTGEPQTRLEVTEMTHKKLTLHIEKLPAKFSVADDEDEEYDADECPSSADIEVVHTKETPPLQSILKQRSVSESSEGMGSSSSGESPTSLSPRDSDGQNKSVHFNSHIDKTTFKSNMSVNSMKVALKSKRRRHRKREEKLEKSRKRHNSTGSECSSCDEHDVKLSGESHSEDDHDDLSQQLDEAGKKVSENGVIIEEEIIEKRAQKKENHAEVCENAEEESVDENDHNKSLSERPDQNKEVKSKMTKGSKLVDDVKKKLAEKSKDDVADSDDEVGDRTSSVDDNVIKTADENAQKIVDRTSGDIVKIDGSGLTETFGKKDAMTSIKGKAADNLEDDSGTSSAIIEQKQGTEKPENHDIVSKSVNTLENGMHEKGDSANECESAVKEQSDSKSGKISKRESGEKDNRQNERAVKENENKSIVETELSWKEPEKAALNNEHRTECAFKFSNEMMFDLDID